MSAVEHIIYGFMWIGFGGLHSLLAREPVKRRLSGYLDRFYRLFYNALATAHFTLVFVGGYLLFATSLEPFSVYGNAQAAFVAAKSGGVLIVLAALFHYDLGQFSGLSQARGPSQIRGTQEHEPLHVTGLHRYVRHPLYTGVFLFLWGSASDEFGLATAVWASAYLIIGTLFEERDLLACHGDVYRKYRNAVPAFVPWKCLKG